MNSPIFGLFSKIFFRDILDKYLKIYDKKYRIKKKQKIILDKKIKLEKLRLKKCKIRKPIKVLKGYENNKNPNSWDDVSIYYIESQHNFYYRSNLNYNLKLGNKSKLLLYEKMLVNKKSIPDNKHKKSLFDQLNRNLKGKFNKKVNPIEYNVNQKVYTIKFNFKILKELRDVKTINMTDKEIEMLQEKSAHSKRYELYDEENPDYND